MLGRYGRFDAVDVTCITLEKTGAVRAGAGLDCSTDQEFFRALADCESG
jgi:hypothetical protein